MMRGPVQSRSGQRSRPLPIPKPFRWYVDWVRANEENATSLERLSRTFAMIVSDPSDLVNMESCWTLSKMHAFVDQAILQTSHRHVGSAEVMTYILLATQEVECLVELLLRKYCRQAATWNALLALQSVKCVLNLCVHRQLFLMPWAWQTVQLYVRRVLRALWLPRYLLTSARRSGAIRAGAGGAGMGARDMGRVYGGGSSNAVSCRLVGEVVGPNDTRLVIPRVVSGRRGQHRHFYSAAAAAAEQEEVEVEDALDAQGVRSSSSGGGGHHAGARPSASSGADDDDSELTAWEKENAEAIPFTCMDAMGMVVDAFLLLRPVLVVAAARHVFPHHGGEGIAKLPHPLAPAGTNAPSKEVAADKSATASTEDAASKADAQDAAAAAAADPMRVLMVALSSRAPGQTLFASWRWWGLFAALDLLVLFLSRYIRAHRVPVVYINDGQTAQQLLEATAAVETGETMEDFVADAPPVSEGGEEDGGQRAADADGAGAPDSPVGTDGGVNANAVSTEAVVSSVPAVVSRDALRLQHATRNLSCTFLRDPFFTVVLKQFIFDHLIKGFVNKIPLLGSLISFQVGYFLSMQHFSFLYSVGQ